MTDANLIYQYLTQRGVTLKSAWDKKAGDVITWIAPTSIPASDIVPLLRSHKDELRAYLVEVEEQTAIFEESGAREAEARLSAVRSVNALRAAGSQPCIRFEGDAKLIRLVAEHPIIRSIESFLLSRGGATLEVFKVA
jgi:hypothetical protein